jgi:tetratricopeptide (TPR) repeat protein
MNRKYQKLLAAILPLIFGAAAVRAQNHPPRVEETKSRGAAAPRLAPAPLLLFGAIPVSTHSQEARKLTESALDSYENVMLDQSILQAQRAVDTDRNFALGNAVLAFTSRRNVPNPAALARAKALLPQATPDEQLMVRWMISIQDRNLLPAIASMNDLLKRYPKDKHVLYLTSSWLYSQQDYERSQKMMESVLGLDPNFPPVLNMLGYAYIEDGHPDPLKAVSMLRRYVEVQPTQPNPEDSLAEVLRYTGDDEGSLEHYRAALQIDHTFFTSQLGLGDTLTLMGKYDDARVEYDKAVKMADNKRGSMHASFQKALVYFWEGRTAAGRSTLAALAVEAEEKKEPYAQFEIGLTSAMLAPDYASELQQLHAVEDRLQTKSDDDMAGADRGASMAAALCEEARVAVRHGQSDVAEQAISKLAQAAAQSGDLLAGNNYETARGYLLVAQGNLLDAADELAASRRSPLAVQQLALTQTQLGDSTAAAESITQLKYQRSPTVEWFLVGHGRDFPR